MCYHQNTNSNFDLITNYLYTTYDAGSKDSRVKMEMRLADLVGCFGRGNRDLHNFCKTKALIFEKKSGVEISLRT